MREQPRKSKPFPWHCLYCGTPTVMPQKEDYSINLWRNGKKCEVTIKNAEVPRCTTCNWGVETSRLSEQIDMAAQEMTKD